MQDHQARNISDTVYQEIKDSELLNRASWAIYETLFHHGPLTAGEVFDHGQAFKEGHTIVKGSVCARLTEMRRQGCVRIMQKRKCRVTGKVVSEWNITGRLPETNSKIIETKAAKIERLERNQVFLEGKMNELKVENQQLENDLEHNQSRFAFPRSE